MSNSKKWSMTFLLICIFLLSAAGGLTALIDPFFHFHAPLAQLTYPIDTERYQNDGIAKQFEYDAVITGTCMSENFRASQFNDLFHTNAVKLCLNGSTCTELMNNLERALKANPNITTVLSSFDEWYMFDEKGLMRTDAEFPDYLYDTNPFNDVQYVLNKEVLFQYSVRVVGNTLEGLPTTDFDSYGAWDTTFGREIALSSYDRPERRPEQQSMTQAELQNLTAVLDDGVIRLAKENPNIQFCYFFPPYSILFWDGVHQNGAIDRQISAFRETSRRMLEQENIHLFAFYDDLERVTNLDLYYDTCHYCSTINERILERMAKGENELTLENYVSYWEKIRDMYEAYNYEQIFES